MLSLLLQLLFVYSSNARKLWLRNFPSEAPKLESSGASELHFFVNQRGRSDCRDDGDEDDDLDQVQLYRHDDCGSHSHSLHVC